VGHGYGRIHCPKDQELAGAIHKKYGEWNATSIDFANPAFAFVPP